MPSPARRERDAFAMTPLNVATTQRFERCERNGGHVVTDTYVARDVFGVDKLLPVCDRCAVPLRGSVVAFGHTPRRGTLYEDEA